MRRSIDVPGLGHGGAPIPQASLVRGLLVSGGINGMDARTGEIGDDLERQVELVFTNIELILREAGGTTADIAKVTFFVADRGARTLIDPHWTRMFPDSTTRPARHVLIADLPATLAIQCEIIAVLESDPQ